jgi:NAD(P)-dependent dehydrogenase (short-subunit alcohol dehydrogenase family)
MSETESNPSLRNTIELLKQLTATPQRFLDPAATDAAQLRELRAQMNRCVASLQSAAVARRKTRNRAREEAKRAAPAAAPSGQLCYMCSQPIVPPERQSPICVACANLQRHYRTAKVDLSGRHAIVTGGRTGVGYEVALRLLECGATVHVTTRFPHDAARQLNSVAWTLLDRDPTRLRIYGLDFRDLAAVRRFIQVIRNQCAPDILVNNAAQTVRRPIAFYRELVRAERRKLTAVQRAMIVERDLHRPMAQQDAGVLQKIEEVRLVRPSGLIGRLQELLRGRPEDEVTGVPVSALLSQVPVLPSDLDGDEWLSFDQYGEAVDGRPMNSWTLGLEDVQPAEMIEVQCINAIAPFMLTQGLFAGLLGTATQPRFVVNLAAAEGSFQVSHRRGTHPHTNMAKAALNMLTRSIAAPMAQRFIYVNSVDPGWVSDQRPQEQAKRAQTTGGLVPPIDPADGAARAMHPIIVGTGPVNDRLSGRLLRHFRVARW